MNLDDNILDDDETGIQRYTPAAWRNFRICILVGSALILCGILSFLVQYWLFMMASFFALFVVLIFSIAGVAAANKAKQAGETDSRLWTAGTGSLIFLIISSLLILLSAGSLFIF